MGKVLVVGSGVAGIQAALDLADSGHKVFLVERMSEIGGNLKNLNQLFITGESASELLANLSSEVKSRKNITLMINSEIKNIEGEFPRFSAVVASSKEKQAIDVNAVILATGFKSYDPSSLKQYKYGLFPDVITSPELEKMLARGKLRVPSNSKLPRSVSIIQCIGSRSKHTNFYCSAFCCLNSVKLALQIKKGYSDIEVTILYMDIRTPYLGERDYGAARRLGVRFLRGNPARVRKTRDSLLIQVEDTLENDLVLLGSDIIVLSVGGEPDPSNKFFKDKLDLELSGSGFLQVGQSPVSTNKTGVFAAGAVCGLKDTSYSIAQGSCAATKANILLKTPSE